MYISQTQETLILTSGLTIVVCSIMFLIFKSMIKTSITTLIKEERILDINRKAHLQMEIDQKFTFDSKFIYNTVTSFKISKIDQVPENKKPSVKPLPMPNILRKTAKINKEQKNILKLSLTETGFIPSENGELEIELSLFTIDHLKKATLIEIFNGTLFLNGNYERVLEIDKSDQDVLVALSNKHIKQKSDTKISTSLESKQCHNCHTVSNPTEWIYKNEIDISCPECGADL